MTTVTDVSFEEIEALISRVEHALAHDHQKVIAMSVRICRIWPLTGKAHDNSNRR